MRRDLPFLVYRGCFNAVFQELPYAYLGRVTHIGPVLSELFWMDEWRTQGGYLSKSDDSGINRLIEATSRFGMPEVERMLHKSLKLKKSERHRLDDELNESIMREWGHRTPAYKNVMRFIDDSSVVEHCDDKTFFKRCEQLRTQIIEESSIMKVQLTLQGLLTEKEMHSIAKKHCARNQTDEEISAAIDEMFRTGRCSILPDTVALMEDGISIPDSLMSHRSSFNWMMTSREESATAVEEYSIVKLDERLLRGRSVGGTFDEDLCALRSELLERRHACLPRSGMHRARTGSCIPKIAFSGCGSTSLKRVLGMSRSPDNGTWRMIIESEDHLLRVCREYRFDGVVFDIPRGYFVLRDGGELTSSDPSAQAFAQSVLSEAYR